MSQYLIDMLATEFKLSEDEINLLNKSKRELNKEERKIYFQKLNPDKRKHREFLMEKYETLGAEERKKWLEITVENLLEKGGEPDIVDDIAIEIIGRIKVYGALKERAQKEGKKVKALAGGGGCLFFFTLGVIIVAIIVILFLGG